MDKLIPDPPHETTAPPVDAIRVEDLTKDREAIKRAVDFYFTLQPAQAHQSSTMFLVNPSIDTETLLAHAYESLASASAMASNFANELSGLQRSTALAIQQIIMLAELAVNRALDRVDPQT
ncbi:DUF6124 family protein [Pseudomonas sp. 13B_3.2_Bac1]|uniref:DUF6124 family protein n=1 Tax=Pseudomonas sp. 13B_3.2_Bac1 TaxID=2971623 RepID=UPI0021C81FD0|nr:DUF6124 family protein [Pseudomonas sp. 13B_3.2_Bac1]MCU1771500.1 DUF6124 family protein [Pseudomonas sp. 13B_3.2_Bac1]